MTMLRKVDRCIENFMALEMPFSLPETKDPSVRAFCPYALVNSSCRLITNSFVDATVRASTSIPGTIVDLWRGVFDGNNQALRDGVITIPKTVTHIVVDAGVVVGVVLCGAIATATATVTVSSSTLIWIAGKGKNAVTSGFSNTVDGIKKIHDA